VTLWPSLSVPLEGPSLPESIRNERGFSGAIDADQRDAIAAVDGEVHAIEHLLGTVVLGEVADFDHSAAGGRRLRER